MNISNKQEVNKMTKKEMAKSIAKEFMIYQSKDKAIWVYRNLMKMKKIDVEAQYEGFIINRTSKITPWH